MHSLEGAPRDATGWRLLACASQGSGSADEGRLRELLTNFNLELVSFNRKEKRQGFLRCLRLLREGRFDLFVLEGTGFAGGLAAILGQLLWRRPYVVSSGDAVAPFLSARLPLGKPLFSLYERALCRYSSGFIGWTPYLVGRALTLGARKGVTVPGWAPFRSDRETLQQDRRRIRKDLGIPEDAVVFGLIGSLVWSQRYGYCYGAELVRAARRSSPSDVHVLVVGDGSGLDPLKELAGELLGKRILLPGRIRRDEVPRYLAAMDVASLPQSVDGVGSFRYSTKLPEYRDAGLMIVTNQIPAAYDLNHGDMIPLPGTAPWDERFLQALAYLMKTATHEQLRTVKREPASAYDFDREQQIARVTVFLDDILQDIAERRRDAP